MFPRHSRAAAAFLLALLVAAAAFAADREITTLTLQEETGTVRLNEPVTMGIPLSEGTVPDAKTLVLKDAARNVIPCQFFEVSKWHTEKGGVRWVHADFQASVAPNGKTVVKLVDTGAPVEAPETKLSATEADGKVTVVTGPLKFVVRGPNFNGFDGAWFDPSGKGDFSDATLVIPPGGKGGSVVTADGKTVSSSGDPDGKVAIERSGPMRVTVKATGTHKNEAGDRVFDYIVRFHAYAGSPVVRITHTFVNRQGEGVGSRFLMKDLAFEIPTVMANPSVAIGTDAAPWTGSVTAGSAAALQREADDFVVLLGNEEKAKGKGMSNKSLSLGWIDLGGGTKHLAAGIRWFWQMNPKAVVAKVDGTLRLGFFPEESNLDHEVFRGQSRTHDITLRFHSGVGPEVLNQFFAGTQLPLRAFAPSAYYCREAKAFGPIAESNPKLFGDDWPKVLEHDKKMSDSMEKIIKKLDGKRYGAPGPVDSYGFYPWGDQYHWYFSKKENSPNDRPEWHYSWAGNYYEYPNTCLLQFLRTGDNRFRDRWESSARHVGDVFICHWHHKAKYIGACRYCPARNHVALDNGSPYVSIEFNHAKSQCVFNLYYLYGDLRSLDNAMLLANNALNNHSADKGWAARGLGAHLAQIWCAWELTGEKKYLDRLKYMAKRGMGPTKSGRYYKGDKFMWGIAYEGMVYAYWATGNEEIIDALKGAYEKRLADEYMISNLVLGVALLYHKTGEEKYKDYAWKVLATADSLPRPKIFGLKWRNSAYALYYLSNAAEKEQ